MTSVDGFSPQEMELDKTLTTEWPSPKIKPMGNHWSQQLETIDRINWKPLIEPMGNHWSNQLETMDQPNGKPWINPIGNHWSNQWETIYQTNGKPFCLVEKWKGKFQRHGRTRTSNHGGKHFILKQFSTWTIKQKENVPSIGWRNEGTHWQISGFRSDRWNFLTEIGECDAEFGDQRQQQHQVHWAGKIHGHGIRGQTGQSADGESEEQGQTPAETIEGGLRERVRRQLDDGVDEAVEMRRNTEKMTIRTSQSTAMMLVSVFRDKEPHLNSGA